jgi:HSP20 family protein
MTMPVVHRGQHTRASVEPFHDLQELQQRTLQILQNAFGDGIAADGAWVPAVDIEETDDSWIVEAELPGAKRDDVNIEVHDNELEISGEIVERERTGIIRRRNRRVGRFDYRVTLPTAIDPDGIDASLDGGILTVRVPKPEVARPRRIPIGTPAGSG